MTTEPQLRQSHLCAYTVTAEKAAAALCAHISKPFANALLFVDLVLVVVELTVPLYYVRGWCAGA